MILLLLCRLLAFLPLFRLRQVIRRRVHLVQKFFEFLHLLLKSLLESCLRLLEVLCQVGVVVMSQASVKCLNLACTIDPLVQVFEDLCLFDVEVSINDSLKALRRILELSKHGPLDVAVAHDVRIAFILALTIFGTGFAFETRFVEVDFI